MNYFENKNPMKFADGNAGDLPGIGVDTFSTR